MGAPQTVLATRCDMKIPVIDVGPFLAGEAGALERTGALVGDAAETLGFFFIGNHGIPQSLIDRVFAEAQRFHELPLERKLEVQAIGKVIGYLPLGGQTQNTSIYAKSTHPDRSASFYIRREFAPDHPDRLAKRPWVSDNRWPKDLPGFRETCLAYYDAMSALGTKMLRLHAVALGSSPKLTPPRRPFSRRPIRCGYSIIRRAIPRWTDNSASARIPITAIALTWRKRSAPDSKFSHATANGSRRRRSTDISS